MDGFGRQACAFAFAVQVVASLCACVSSDDPTATFSRVRVSSMGPSQFMISCIDSPHYCADQSNRSCPTGFDVVSNVTNPGDFGRMTMIIKCHGPDQSAAPAVRQ
jgi:hypothetical protein